MPSNTNGKPTDPGTPDQDAPAPTNPQTPDDSPEAESNNDDIGRMAPTDVPPGTPVTDNGMAAQTL